MKICTSYFQSEYIRNQVQEIRYSMTALTPALEYSERHPEKKVIIEIFSLDDDKLPKIDKLHSLQQEHENIYYDFYILSDLVTYSKTFGRTPTHIMFHQPATTWGLIQILMYYNVSDITIDEPLTFNMPEIAANVRANGINIRIRPNIAKNRYEQEMESDSGIRHFWVLPQHLNFYEEYVDVLDLIDNNSERETAVVNTYLSNKPYEASLSLLVEGIEKDVGASFIDDRFVIRRLNCGQTCMKNTNYCHYCDTMMRMYDIAAARHESSN